MYKIGIDAGGTTLKLGVVENGLYIVHRDTRPTTYDPAQMADTLYRMILAAQEKYPGAEAAISVAGTLDEMGNLTANQMGLENAPVGPILFEKLGKRIPMENDGICALMAEHRLGALKGCQTALMITLGTGVGGGVIVDGKPLRGKNGLHAELGHMITHVHGKLCTCEQTGCWESYASATALSELAGGMKPRDVIEEVRRGGLTDIWQSYLHEVAQGLIGLCSIFHPEKIAIGGGLSNAGEIVVGGIRDAIMRDPGYALYYAPMDIVPAHFLNDAGILGAAALL